MTDREKLIALLRATEITKINGHVVQAETCFTPNVFEKFADNLIANSVEAAPVVHGRWVLVKPRRTGRNATYKCTACGQLRSSYYNDVTQWKHCPCGARMDGDGNAADVGLSPNCAPLPGGHGQGYSRKKSNVQALQKKTVELANEYQVAFTHDPEADYKQEQLDAALREIWKDELQPFYERYPYVKKINYTKPIKGGNKG